jgi:hypothetical protein
MTNAMFSADKAEDNVEKEKRPADGLKAWFVRDETEKREEREPRHKTQSTKHKGNTL